MKAILEFDLNEPEERQEHLRAVKSLSMALALSDMREVIRRFEKYEAKTEAEHAAIEKIKSQFYEILENNNVDLSELIS